MGNFFEIDDYSKFGELVKKWATGRESRKPTAPKEFIKLLKEHGIEAKFPDIDTEISTIREVEYADLQNDVLRVTIPTPRMLKVGLNLAENLNGAYPFPEEYKMGFEGQTPELNLTEDQRRELFYARIGDYVVTYCM